MDNWPHDWAFPSEAEDSTADELPADMDLTVKDDYELEMARELPGKNSASLLSKAEEIERQKELYDAWTEKVKLRGQQIWQIPYYDKEG